MKQGKKYGIFSRPSIKYFGLFHFYRHPKHYTYRTTIDLEDVFGDIKRKEFPRLTYNGWSQRIKKLCPYQFYFRETILKKLEDYFCILSCYPLDNDDDFNLSFSFHLKNLYKSVKNYLKLTDYNTAKDLGWEIWRNFAALIKWITTIWINYDCTLYKKYSDINYEIKCWFKPQNIIKINKFKRNDYISFEYKLKYAVFEMFEDYFKSNEKELKFQTDKHWKDFYKECKSIYKWWIEKGKTDYYQKKIDKIYENKKLKSEIRFERVSKIETSALEDYKKNLIRIINIMEKFD
jgi:hypothetical protein